MRNITTNTTTTDKQFPAADFILNFYFVSCWFFRMIFFLLLVIILSSPWLHCCNFWQQHAAAVANKNISIYLSIISKVNKTQIFFCVAWKFLFILFLLIKPRRMVCSRARGYANIREYTRNSGPRKYIRILRGSGGGGGDGTWSILRVFYTSSTLSNFILRWLYSLF